MRTLVLCVFITLLSGCATPPPHATKEAGVSPDKVYYNPVDKKAYATRSGWKLYKPEHPEPEKPEQKIKVDQIRLLTSEEDLAVRVSVMDLAAYVREAERLANVTLAKSDKPFRLLVQFNCNPTGHKIKMASQGAAPKKMLQAYWKALDTAKKLPVKQGEASFIMEFTIKP